MAPGGSIPCPILCLESRAYHPVSMWVPQGNSFTKGERPLQGAEFAALPPQNTEVSGEALDPDVIGGRQSQINARSGLIQAPPDGA